MIFFLVRVLIKNKNKNIFFLRLKKKIFFFQLKGSKNSEHFS